jgi:hypothetical protein
MITAAQPSSRVGIITSLRDEKGALAEYGPLVRRVKRNISPEEYLKNP